MKTKLKRAPYTLYYLIWDDAIGKNSWFTLEDAEEWKKTIIQDVFFSSWIDHHFSFYFDIEGNGIRIGV